MTLRVSIILAALLPLCGCSSVPLRTTSYAGPAVRVVCMSDDMLNASYRMRVGESAPHVGGFYIAEVRCVFVRWSDDLDKDGEPLPDFYFLGHEYWHSIKGNFHQ